MKLFGFLHSTSERLRDLVTSILIVVLFGTVVAMMRRYRRHYGVYEIGWMLMMISFGLVPILRMGFDQEPLRLASNLIVLPLSGVFIQRRLYAFVSIGFVFGSALLCPLLMSVPSRTLIYYMVLLALSLVAGIYVHLMMRLLLRRVTHLLKRLRAARSEIHELAGFLPICAWCKSIRDDEGYWEQVEAYLAKKSRLSFTHGMCPLCRTKMETEFEAEMLDREEPAP